MKQVIDRILDGQFEYERGTLEFSTERIELTIKPGEDVEGSFSIKGPEAKYTEGTVSATEVRMEVLTPEFVGSDDSISYRFRGEGLSAGDVLKGNFRVISNQGEYFLPFVVSVEAQRIGSSLGDIKNLFHFANLAKTNWDEAVDLFYSPQFIRIFTGNDSRYEGLYRGFSAQKHSQQNVEEFLLAVNKKTRMEFLPDQVEIHLDNVSDVTEHVIHLERNGWGYTHLDIALDGDFLSCDRRELTENEFDGNGCDLYFYVHRDRMHDGNNMGSIILKNPYVNLRIPVYATPVGAGTLNHTGYKKKKQLVAKLMLQYIAFRSQKINSRAWLAETGKIIAEMNALDANDLEFRLYQAQYLITAARMNEGEWILQQVKPRILEKKEGGINLYCYYLYLTTLCSREEVYTRNVSDEILEIYNDHPGNWRLAWLLQYVSENYAGSASHRWQMLKQQFEMGCRSPIIYLEAVHLLVQNVSLLTQADDFEITILDFACRKKLLTAPLIEQIVFLAGRMRREDKRIARILTTCYEIKPMDSTLEVICSRLIADQRIDETAFGWYRLGVDRQLRITGLYEYYMMSIYTDERGNLPCEISKMVLMFFSYQSDLDYKKNAILYKYVYENRDILFDLYANYEPQIQRFVKEQISRGRINRELGYLYQNLLTEDMVDSSNASAILSAIHTCEISVSENDFDITEVVVIYDKCSSEITYPVMDGKAYVPLYGSEYTVMLADRQNNCYVVTVPFETEKLMISGKTARYTEPYISADKQNTEMFLAELGKSAYTITMENVERYRLLAEAPIVRDTSRSEIRQNLIRFYYDNDFDRQLTDYLLALEPERLTGKERGEMLELMVLTGLYDSSVQWLKRFGTHGVDIRTIVRLCGRMPEAESYYHDKTFTEIVFYAFRKGKYDEEVLRFLLQSFDGTVREMRDIWKASEGFGIDNYFFAEKILRQVLYSGAYAGGIMEIYKKFAAESVGSELERAFLAQNAYSSFVKEHITDSIIFERIQELTMEGVALPDVCGYAYLAYYADDHGEKHTGPVTEKFLTAMLEKKIYFPFCQQYLGVVPGLRQLEDKTILMYRSVPGSRCTIHYILSTGEEAPSEYKSEKMREMYEGIFVCSFVLFFGEQLQYYITEEVPGRESSDASSQLTESGTITQSEIGKEHHSGKYELINDLMIGMTLQDYSTADKLLADYSRKEYIISKLFPSGS